MLEKNLQLSFEYVNNIINTVRESLIVLDSKLRVITVSHSFYNFFKVKPEDTIGQLIYDLGNKQWDIPKLRELLETILPQKTTFEDYEVEHDFATIGRRIMLLNARQIEQASGKERIILLAIEDITDRRAVEDGLEKTRKELEVIKKSADEASEFAESIINTVREPLIALDQDLRVVTVSRSFYDIFKVKPEETVGQLIYDLGNHQWNIPKLRELLETILPQKTTFEDYEVEHDFATIGRRIMLLNARQIEQAIGRERIILLAIEDITERRAVEDGLEKTRKELEIIKKTADAASEFTESIINTIREPLLALDQDLRVVAVSRSFYEFFKVKPEETVGELIYNLGNKQWDIPKLRELLETVLPLKATFQDYEVEHNFATIGRRIMHLNARQIEQASGKERIILLAIEDITERRAVEDGLEKTRKELEIIKKTADAASEFTESIINTIREPLLALDQDLRVVAVSRSFYEFFKVKPEETIGQLIYDLGNHQWNIPKLRELLETILPQKTTFEDYEVEHNFATIGRRIMHLNARQIEQASGKERIILLAIEDITERRAVEDRLKHAKEETEKAHREKVEFKAKSEFMANMSHEIRTPLNGVLGLTELVLKTNLDEKQRDYLEKARTSSKALLHIINDVLDYSKIEAGKLNLENREFELENVMRNIKDLFEYQAKKKGLSLNIEGDYKLTLVGDALRLTQILTNVVGNAIKFTEKGSIAIKVELVHERKHSKKLQFFIKDSGIGIDIEAQKHLFKEFAQADSSITRQYGGTGLGLSISKHLVHMMGGEIWAESKEGEGSTFVFSALFGNADDKTSNTLATQATHPKLNTDSIKGAHVLLVEDNKINQTVAIGMLEDLGLTTETANNGKEAVDMINAGKEYDLILMDLQMPIMDGFEASKKIKSINKNIPIIALSAAVMQEDIIRTNEAKMSAHLAKPISEDELIEALLKFIKPKHNIQQTLKKVGKEISSEEVETQFYGVDLEELKHRIGNKPKVIKQLLTSFCQEYKDPQQMFDVSKIDTDDFNRALHSLKGVSGNIALKEIFKLSKKLNGTQDLQIKQELTPKLVELLSETVQNLVIQLNVTESKVSRKKYSKEEVLKYLQEIREDVKHFRVLTHEKIELLENMLALHVDRKIIKELMTYLLGYKYKEADTVLNEIYKLWVD